MESFREDLLSLGTVVSLKNFNKKLMIIGYTEDSDAERFDYYGCLYPEGFSGSESVVCFKHDMLDFSEEFEETIEEVENNTEYEFDEDGNLVAEDGMQIIGLGLPMEEETEEVPEYEFDEDGNLVAEDGIQVAGLGLPMEEEETEEVPEYEFDEDGNLVAEDGMQVTGLGLPMEEEETEEVPEEEFKMVYLFDEDGNFIASEESLEDVPPIGPGLPGYVEPKKVDNEFLDYNAEGNSFDFESLETTTE